MSMSRLFKKCMKSSYKHENHITFKFSIIEFIMSSILGYLDWPIRLARE